VAATNRDLKAEVAAGRFRPDLFYRLSIIEIRLTPLRQRPDDVCYLTARFVRECAERLNLTITGITPSAERVLQSEAWPGNVRELKNVIERACILTDNKILTERDILHALDSTQAGTRLNLPLPPEPGVDSNMFSTAQRVHIERVLRQAGGNKSAAAKLLGMSRRSLYRWLDRLKLGENGES
jgi:two-component system response regulator AtoC